MTHVFRHALHTPIHGLRIALRLPRRTAQTGECHRPGGADLLRAGHESTHGPMVMTAVHGGRTLRS
jgi:hypothetical protein